MSRWAIAAMVATTLSFGSSAPAAFGGKADPASRFTLVVLPDSQLAVQNKPELFDAQIEWIVGHHRQRDIPFVIHVGDVVEWPSRVSDWRRATEAMYRLNGVVPYAIAVGNHDFDAWACTPADRCDPNQSIATNRGTIQFNTYFPAGLFLALPSFVGSFPNSSSDNTAFRFGAGGVEWLVVSLKYRPTAEELAWADQIIAWHPQCRVIINTHDYQNGSTRSPAGERIWNDLVRRHRNVWLVLSGHYPAAGVLVDRADQGNTVYQIQADYQTYSIPDVRENGYLRLMEFDTHTGSLTVRTFSPYCEATRECPRYKSDPNNEFVLTISRA